jgi:hypothetical protein
MLTSIIRTAVPYLVGLIVSAFTFAGVTVSDELRASLVSLVTFVIGTVYYVGVRFLEKKWPKIGVLLGVPTPPVYGTTVAPTMSTTAFGPEPIDWDAEVGSTDIKNAGGGE